MSEKKHNIFYKTTNLVNGKFYYGIHSTDKLEDGYLGSGTALKNAVRHYGTASFRREVIMDYPTRKEANEHEKLVVTAELTESKMCYNIVLGGKSEYIPTEQDCLKLTGVNNPFYGKTHTPESRSKMKSALDLYYSENDIWSKGHTKETHPSLMAHSIRMSGENHPNFGKTATEFQKQRVRETHTGKIVSEETRKRMSAAQSGEKNYMFGKKHTKERIDKIKANNPKNKPCVIFGIEYMSCREAGRQLNIPKSTIQHRVLSTQVRWSEYYFIEIDNKQEIN